MPQPTAAAAAEAELTEAPPDITTMRDAVNRLLDPDAVPEALPPAPGELETLTIQLRGHLDLLMPEVEQAAQRLPKDDIPRYCALACLGEARGKLRAEPSPTPHGSLAYARRLARVLNALCDHYEQLSRR
ncbi:DUF6415 family natural product biosynthesis protein [Streptomyces sviceus]|uniref:DUF6415 family natural product biosynthesis protein n=1 Tax=Streptomyces sviceus TaxID=285530 RepID=UPI00381B42F8